MKRVFRIMVLAIVSSFFIACGEESELTPQMPTVSKAAKAAVEKKPEKFTAPEATAKIEVEKARQYVNASAALLLLGEQWSGRIEKASDEEKAAILAEYANAQNQVCSRVGLLGMDEYNWLDTIALKNTANAEAFKQAGVKF